MNSKGSTPTTATTSTLATVAATQHHPVVDKKVIRDTYSCDSKGNHGRYISSCSPKVCWTSLSDAQGVELFGQVEFDKIKRATTDQVLRQEIRQAILTCSSTQLAQIAQILSQ